jgi:large subunit ribosomal protein L4
VRRDDAAGGAFDGPVRKHLLYESVKMQRANRRAGTAVDQDARRVRGGGKKPWRQKGPGAPAPAAPLADLGRRGDHLRTAGRATTRTDCRPVRAQRAALGVVGKVREGQLLSWTRSTFDGQDQGGAQMLQRSASPAR